MLTCKDFLDGLNDYLDEVADPELRKSVEAHISQCPNCWVIHDTTKKTLQVFRGMEPQELPPSIHDRLMQAIERKMKPPAE